MIDSFSVCNNTLVGYRGVIESPNFPNEYAQDLNCWWDIIVTDRNKINITFSHFDLESSFTFNNKSCISDYLEVKINENGKSEYRNFIFLDKIFGRKR